MQYGYVCIELIFCCGCKIDLFTHIHEREIAKRPSATGVALKGMG